MPSKRKTRETKVTTVIPCIECGRPVQLVLWVKSQGDYIDKLTRKTPCCWECCIRVHASWSGWELSHIKPLSEGYYAK